MNEMNVLEWQDYLFDEYLNFETEYELREVAYRDDRPGFIALTKSLHAVHLTRQKNLDKNVPETIEATYCPPEIFEWVLQYDAVDCAKALLEGDTDLFINLNVPFKVGLYPLHIAAEGLSYGMVDLLLCHGAWTDVRTIEGEYRGDLLPLNVALDMLSYHLYLSDWTPKKSIFKLIAILSLPQMKVPLETNRLLAWNTKDVDIIFNNYAMEGKLIQMTALLMIAREKILASSTLQSKDSSGLGGGMMIRQCIFEEIGLLAYEEVKLKYINHNWYRRLNNKQEVMIIALLLLKVFDRAGDAIETYRQSVQCHMSKEKVGKDIKALLEEAGFDFKDKDVALTKIDCESEDIKLATEVLEKRSSFRSQLQYGSMLRSLPGSFDEAKNPITDKVNELRWSIRLFLPWGSPALSFEGRCFHEYKLAHCNSTSGITAFQFPIVNRKRRAMKIPAAFFLTSKDFTTFGLAIKRGLTRI